MHLNDALAARERVEEHGLGARLWVADQNRFGQAVALGDLLHELRLADFRCRLGRLQAE